MRCTEVRELLPTLSIAPCCTSCHDENDMTDVPPCGVTIDNVDYDVCCSVFQAVWQLQHRGNV